MGLLYEPLHILDHCEFITEWEYLCVPPVQAISCNNYGESYSAAGFYVQLENGAYVFAFAHCFSPRWEFKEVGVGFLSFISWLFLEKSGGILYAYVLHDPFFSF